MRNEKLGIILLVQFVHSSSPSLEFIFNIYNIHLFKHLQLCQEVYLEEVS